MRAGGDRQELKEDASERPVVDRVRVLLASEHFRGHAEREQARKGVRLASKKSERCCWISLLVRRSDDRVGLRHVKEAFRQCREHALSHEQNRLTVLGSSIRMLRYIVRRSSVLRNTSLSSFARSS